MTTGKIIAVKPKGKKSGAWIIKGVTPPPATNGIEVFYGKKQQPPKTAAHA